MKALIQFEIPDDPKKTEDQVRDKLIESIANIIDEWIKGDAIILIDFFQTYESTSTQSNYFAWNSDTTGN